VAVPLAVVVLAGGENSRNFSKTPFYLLPVAGRPMVEHALLNAEALHPSKTFVVMDSSSRELASHVGKRAIPVFQKKDRGSGAAVLRVLRRLRNGKGNVLILHADDCLTPPPLVLALRQFHLFQDSAAAFLTARLKSPFRYGRVVRGPGGDVERIVEEDDATEEQRRITEVQAGVYCFKAQALFQALKTMESAAGARPFHMTQTVPHVRARGGKVQALTAPDQTEVFGISRPEHLTWAHRILNLRRVREHQAGGVIFLDARTVDIDPAVVIGRGAVIEGNVKLLGGTRVGEGARIESGSVVQSSRLGREVVVKASRISDSVLGDGCDAGPFAHVRSGCVLEESVHVGTNTELKNVRMGKKSKAGHFSYVGDAVLGRGVNVGAGCVFANYDGKSKHGCRVGDGAFLGSNSTLVAPVGIGAKAVVAAGAVVTRNVAPGTRVAGVPARPMGKK
jgi:bifunctional UDP-N-acetylglucosamine pyrophosphorylase / glucosamine-1-phosphate N-acetyltransferase